MERLATGGVQRMVSPIAPRIFATSCVRAHSRPYEEEQPNYSHWSNYTYGKLFHLRLQMLIRDLFPVAKLLVILRVGPFNAAVEELWSEFCFGLSRSFRKLEWCPTRRWETILLMICTTVMTQTQYHRVHRRRRRGGQEAITRGGNRPQVMDWYILPSLLQLLMPDFNVTTTQNTNI